MCPKVQIHNSVLTLSEAVASIVPYWFNAIQVTSAQGTYRFNVSIKEVEPPSQSSFTESQVIWILPGCVAGVAIQNSFPCETACMPLGLSPVDMVCYSPSKRELQWTEFSDPTINNMPEEFNLSE